MNKDTSTSPHKSGQIVKFRTPLPDEDPNQQYIVIEVKKDTDNPRVDIKPLGTGLTFPGVNTVSLKDLEVVEIETNDLVGHQVTIEKSDNSKVIGQVVSVDVSKINPDFKLEKNGVKTNLTVTIKDNSDKKHVGNLFVTNNI